MILKTDGLYDKYETCINKYKNNGANIKDIVYAITLGDYFDREAEGVSRLNVDKITLLCTAEPKLAQLLEIESGYTKYTSIDEPNIRRLLYSLLATLQSGSLKNLDGTEEDIALLLQKESDGKNFPIVDQMLKTAGGVHKYFAKNFDALKKKCYDRLNSNSIDAEQVLAVLDVITTIIMVWKNNKTDEALTKVKINNEKEKQGGQKLKYVLHLSSDVYNNLKGKEHVKKVLFDGFEGIREQSSKKLSEVDIKDLMTIFNNFVFILSLLV